MHPTEGDGNVTGLLARLSEGDEAAQEQLVSEVYAALRELARHFMRSERAGHTLQTTALVNEACVRLLGLKDVRWEDRAHFFRVAARAMRRVLVDHARGRDRQKRGSGATKLTLDAVGEEAARTFSFPPLDLIALDSGLNKLAESHPRPARVVELLFYAGLTRPEAADVLGVTRSTVDRDWRYARVWLIREMEAACGSDGSDPGPHPSDTPPE